jgi:NAD(P)-dependent dehydrogenase (short-subunit alcohol dehydrogenase family)
MVTAGDPPYGRLLDGSPEDARRLLTARLVLPLDVARAAAGKVTPRGSLIFIGSTGHRRPRLGEGVISTVSVATPMLIANLALELEPVRVNLIAPGFVNTPLSARLLGDELEQRRRQLRATLPIGRVVEPADIGSIAVQIMSNTAITGATFDIDGGQQFVE